MGGSSPEAARIFVAATQAVTKGDFTPRVPRWADDEIGDLADAFNAMTEELRRECTSAEAISRQKITKIS